MAYGEKFYPGDFITNKYNKGSFMIFEGIKKKSKYGYTTEYTVVCSFKKNKYHWNSAEGKAEYYDELLYATKTSDCSEMVSDEYETFYTNKCTDEEKQEAIETLKKYNLAWNEDAKELIDIKANKVIHSIPKPRIAKYDGQTVHLLSFDGKKSVQASILSKGTVPTQRDFYEECYGYWD